MPNTTFYFKQFTIQQNKCAMKVGTDAVLLGAWVDGNFAEKILDIGTGTGVIALMLAQRFKATIDAIDIDAASCEQALENVRNSKWSDRVVVRNISLQQFAQEKKHLYNLIVSNPPFFVHSSKSFEESRTMARHAYLLPYQDLLDGVLNLLSAEGKFALILPFKEGEVFRDLAEKRGLYLTKLTRVHTRKDKAEKRLLMQFERVRKHFSEDSIAIEYDDPVLGYTKEYKDLTKDFYLNF